jgi:hypothetical protein
MKAQFSTEIPLSHVHYPSTFTVTLELTTAFLQLFVGIR